MDDGAKFEWGLYGGAGFIGQHLAHSILQRNPGPPRDPARYQIARRLSPGRYRWNRYSVMAALHVMQADVRELRSTGRSIAGLSTSSSTLPPSTGNPATRPKSTLKPMSQEPKTSAAWPRKQAAGKSSSPAVFQSTAFTIIPLTKALCLSRKHPTASPSWRQKISTWTGQKGPAGG